MSFRYIFEIELRCKKKFTTMAVSYKMSQQIECIVFTEGIILVDK